MRKLNKELDLIIMQEILDSLVDEELTYQEIYKKINSTNSSKVSYSKLNFLLDILLSKNKIKKIRLFSPVVYSNGKLKILNKKEFESYSKKTFQSKCLDKKELNSLIGYIKRTQKTTQKKLLKKQASKNIPKKPLEKFILVKRNINLPIEKGGIYEF